MWSELFFIHLKQTFNQFFIQKSSKDIEYELFQELKSDSYEPFRLDFIKNEVEYPKISIEYCPVMKRINPFIRKNFIVEYESDLNQIKVCNNYVISNQNLREEFRRENQLAYDRLILKKDLISDVHSLATSMIRSCRAELEASEVRRGQNQKALDNVTLKCAQYNLKIRGKNYMRGYEPLRDKNQWHYLSREIIEQNQQALYSEIPFKKTESKGLYIQIMERNLFDKTYFD